MIKKTHPRPNRNKPIILQTQASFHLYTQATPQGGILLLTLTTPRIRRINARGNSSGFDAHRNIQNSRRNRGGRRAVHAVIPPGGGVVASKAGLLLLEGGVVTSRAHTRIQ